MAGRLDGKVAIITGGTSGIGEATVRVFVSEGACVVIAGRSVEAGEALAEELGRAAVFVRADVTREEDIERMVRETVGRFGRIDCLFNNAGGPTPGGVESVTPEQIRYAADLLLGSVVLGIKHVVPVMRSQSGGRIINNASVNAHAATAGDYLYGAAKAAVLHITRAAAVQLGSQGITVNAISPGIVETQALDFFPNKDELIRIAKLKTSVGRLVTPDDVADVCEFMASPLADMIHGQTIHVDGGYSILA